MNAVSVSRIESTVSEWYGEDLWSDRYVSVDKVGGGTVGNKYDGLWYATVYDADQKPVWESDAINTGTPMTHEDVAELALDYHEHECEES